MDHNKLAEDLAEHLATPFIQVPLGSVWMGVHTQIADVVNIQKSYTRFCLSIFEVKVSRQDFLSDIKSDKWRGYLEHCHRFYFAVPKGLVGVGEVPPEAGLIVRSESTWYYAKGAPSRHVEIPEWTLYSLIFLRRRRTRRERQLEAAQGYRKSEGARRFGKKVAKAVATLQELDQQRRRYEALARVIREEFGLDPWRLEVLDLRDRIRELKGIG